MANKTIQILILLITIYEISTVNSIGVNYGTHADNLPPPKEVAKFLKDKTIIDRIKIFDVNPDILSAFADTGIFVAVTIPNGEIPNLVDVGYARQWLVTNIKPFYPKTKINYILVGNEILHWGPEDLRINLVAAMKSVHTALGDEGMDGIKVTTAHSLGILDAADPPSLGRFRPFWEQSILVPLLQFHQDTKSPFMINPYPYFGYTAGNASFALFQPNKGVFDQFTKRTYGNMFDMLLDAVYIAMKKLGFEDVDLSAGETGWASLGDVWEIQCSIPNAAAYNGGLVKKYNAGRGTPLIPKKTIETYIFGLFNENQKEGSLAEKNFGLFRPDFTPVYDIGIMKAAGAAPAPVQNTPTPARPAPSKGHGGSARPSPAGGKKWCIPKTGASNAALQDNLNYVCSQPDVNCIPIQPGGVCFNPSTVRAHAAYAMNAFYQAKGRNNFNCDFGGTGVIVFKDPSTGTCKYIS